MDRQADGIAVASTVLAMRALRRAVKMGVVLIKHRSESQWTALLLSQQMLAAITALFTRILSFSKTL